MILSVPPLALAAVAAAWRRRIAKMFQGVDRRWWRRGGRRSNGGPLNL